MRRPEAAVAGFRADKKPTEAADHYMAGVIIHGSPARVVDELKRLEEELPLNYLLLSPLSEKTFDLFSEQVLPKVLG